ncbi:MAG: hypothetical protein ACK5HL_03275 [Bacilli bacterium]
MRYKLGLITLCFGYLILFKMNVETNSIITFSESPYLEYSDFGNGTYLLFSEETLNSKNINKYEFYLKECKLSEIWINENGKSIKYSTSGDILNIAMTKFNTYYIEKIKDKKDFHQINAFGYKIDKLYLSCYKNELKYFLNKYKNIKYSYDDITYTN